MHNHTSLPASTAVGLAVGALAIFTYLLCVSAANATPICMQWPEMKDFLAKRYGEVPAGGGQVHSTSVVQVLTSPGGATWTIVIVNANGNACALTAGKNWEQVRVGEKGEEPT